MLLWVLSGTASLTAAPLVWHVFSSENPDLRMERILYLSAGVALVEAGYSSVQDVGGAAGRSAYVLETDYRLRAASIRVSYALRSADGRALADTTLVADLEVDLDRQIADAVDDLLRDAALPRLESPDAEIAGFGIAGVQGTPEVDGNAPEDSGIGDVTPPPPDASPMPSPTPTPDPARPSERAPTPDPGTRPGAGVPDRAPTTDRGGGPWRMTVGGGTGLVVGEAADLFRNSVFARAVVDYRPAATGPVWDVGIAGSIHRVYRNGDVSGGRLYISTIGPSVALEFLSGGFANATVGVSAGPAVVSVYTGDTARSKTVPFVEALSRLFVAVSPRIAAGLSIGWVSVFEGGMVIQGFTSTVMVSFTP